MLKTHLEVFLSGFHIFAHTFGSHTGGISHSFHNVTLEAMNKLNIFKETRMIVRVMSMHFSMKLLWQSSFVEYIG